MGVGFSDRYLESTNLMVNSQGRPSARRALTDSYSDFLPRNCTAGSKFARKASPGSAYGVGDMNKFTGDGDLSSRDHKIRRPRVQMELLVRSGRS